MHPISKSRVLLVGVAFAVLQSVGYSQEPSGDAKAKASAQVVNASADQNGNQHPGTEAIRGPSSIKCLSAVGQGTTYKPSCNVTAPGYSGIVDIGKTVGASGAGTVTLTCNGQGALRCSISITP
jgi:hypothetical protein